MKAIFEACYTGNGGLERLHMLLSLGEDRILGEAQGFLPAPFSLSRTMKRHQESFIYEDGWISLKPLSLLQFPKSSVSHKRHYQMDKNLYEKEMHSGIH